MTTDIEKERRWRMALGTQTDQCSAEDQKLSGALDKLYAQGGGPNDSSRKAGLGGSAPKVSKWMGDIRELFPQSVVQVLQQDALDRLGLKAMLGDPEILKTLEPDVHLVADLMTLRGAIPDTAKGAVREIIQKLVEQLMERLEKKTAQTIRGALNKSKRTHRPRHNDIDWGRTIRANLHTYQPERKIIIPEKLVGYTRQTKRKVDLDEVHIVIDQSGSMGPSVIYSSIFSAVLASLPVVKTRLVAFDTSIIDLTEDLQDPVEVLWGIQLGGGTDINKAVAYTESKMVKHSKSHMVLITDLYEGGNARDLVTRLAKMKEDGVNVIILLALSDEGKPAYHPGLARKVADMDIPVFACTPDQFPDLMSTALKREDVNLWAAQQGIKTIAAEDGEDF
mgnify:CR=1 FL=1